MIPQTSKYIKSTDRSLLCNGCSGTPSKTQLSPACRGWWPRRSRTGSAADPSNSKHTRRAREPRTARTRCTWPWRTVMDRRDRHVLRLGSLKSLCKTQDNIVALCWNIILQCKKPFLYLIWYKPSWGASLLEKSSHVVPSSQLSLRKEKQKVTFPDKDKCPLYFTRLSTE